MLTYPMARHSDIDLVILLGDEELDEEETYEDELSEATLCLAQCTHRSLEGQEIPYIYATAADASTHRRGTKDALAETNVLCTSQLDSLAKAWSRRMDERTGQAGTGKGGFISMEESTTVGRFLLLGSRLRFWPEAGENFAGLSYTAAAKAIRTMRKPSRNDRGSLLGFSHYFSFWMTNGD
ncbi:hypothetical protein LX36DRAFT_729139 [Colletotrichum falcatum]|nr:hypothetical protein LX36DRAFT_729139 [Colletotrichum falcatum]